MEININYSYKACDRRAPLSILRSNSVDMLGITGRYALLGGMLLLFSVLAAGCTSLDDQIKPVQQTGQVQTSVPTTTVLTTPIQEQSLDGLGEMVQDLARDWKMESYSDTDTTATATLVNSAGDRVSLMATRYQSTTEAHAAYLGIQKQASQFQLSDLSIADEGYGYTQKNVAEAGARSTDLLMQVTYQAKNGQANLDQAASMARQMATALA
jgi:hypothetical protein